MIYREYRVRLSLFIASIIVFIYLLIRGIKIIKNRKINLYLEISRLLLMLYIMELISVTLFPMFIIIGNKPSFLPITYRQRTYSVPINLNPFYYKFDHASVYTIIKNIVGNMFIMLPYTILLAFNFKSMRKWYISISTALLTSISIEMLQFIWQLTMLDPGRRTDINDVIQNIIGASIGFILYHFIFRKVPIMKPFIINDITKNKDTTAIPQKNGENKI